MQKSAECLRVCALHSSSSVPANVHARKLRSGIHRSDAVQKLTCKVQCSSQQLGVVGRVKLFGYNRCNRKKYFIYTETTQGSKTSFFSLPITDFWMNSCVNKGHTYKSYKFSFLICQCENSLFKTEEHFEGNEINKSP